MIQESGEYFLYRHIRLDTNVPFYVGIGKKGKYRVSYQWEYRRAFEGKKSSKRNNFWKRIVNKTNYKIEILLESDNLNFIKEKEKEFIKLYGRADLGLGTLCNLTDGGDGCENFKFSKEQLYKLSRIQRNNLAKSVILMDLNGNFIKEFETITDISKFLNNSRSNIKLVCNKIAKSTNGIIERSVNGYLVCYKQDYKENFYKFDLTQVRYKMSNHIKDLNKKARKVVYQYTLDGKLVKKWESGIIADKYLNLRCGSCTNMAGRIKRSKILHSLAGYYWSYDMIDFEKLEKIKRKNGVITLKIK